MRVHTQMVEENSLAGLVRDGEDYANTLIYYELVVKNSNNSDSNSNLEVVAQRLRDNSSVVKSAHLVNLNENEKKSDNSGCVGCGLLVIANSHRDVAQIEKFVADENELSFSMERRPLPFSSSNICLTSGLCDEQLNQLEKLEDTDTDSELKSHAAIKLIQDQTGLQLQLPQKESHISGSSSRLTYFSGVLFQFILLDRFFLQNLKEKESHKREITKAVSNNTNNINEKDLLPLASSATTKERHPSSNKETIEWHTLYDRSEHSYNFQVKSKYDVYVFQSDLTELNTDALVNAASADLHPGYDGDTIARRIREKAGKQMQDACKAIIRGHASGLLDDAEVVWTKSFGKLRSRYVLHAVAPTWTKYMGLDDNYENEDNENCLNNNDLKTSNSNNAGNYSANGCDDDDEEDNPFEPKLAETFENLLLQFTQNPSTSLTATATNNSNNSNNSINSNNGNSNSSTQLTSIALPVSQACGSAGGAFDVPLELLAYTLFTKLVEFESPKNQDQQQLMKTICITSVEPDTVKTLCEIFAGYQEALLESSWAMPVSPMSRLVQKLDESRPPRPLRRELKKKILQKITTEKITTTPTLSVPITTANATTHHPANNNNNNNNNSNNQFESSNSICNSSSSSEGSSSESSSIENCSRIVVTASDSDAVNLRQNHTHPFAASADACCLFCRNENDEENEETGNISVLVTCGNPPETCKGAYCEDCIRKYFAKQQQQQQQTLHKCPSCHKEMVNRTYSSSTSSTVPNPASAPSSSSSSSSLAPMKITVKNNKINNNNVDAERNRSSSSSSLSPARIIVQQQQNHYHQQHQHHQQQQNHNYHNHHNQNQNHHNNNNRNHNHTQNYQNGNKQQQHQYQQPNGGGGYSNSTSNIDTNCNNNNNGIQRKRSTNSQSHSNENSNVLTRISSSNSVSEGKLFIIKLDEPCQGYEKYTSIQISFEIPDGVQNMNHPKPNQPYKGCFKRAYLPNVKEHYELLQFYEKALKSGKLFKIEWNVKFGGFSVHLNPNVSLKTKLSGGGRYGYPDSNYIDDLLKMARSLK